MFGLTAGELLLLCFIVLAVVSWPWWPRLGAAAAGLMAGSDDPAETDRGNPDSSDE
jgi:hypothetical protein